MDAKYCALTKRCLETTDKSAEAHCATFRQLCMKTLPCEKYGIERDVLEKRVGSLSDQLLSHIKTECRFTVDKLKLDKKLRHLEKLIEEQEKYKGTQAWRPSGNPDHDVEDHLRGVYENSLRCLTAKLKECEGKNKALQAQISKGEKELESISIDIELTTSKIEKVHLAQRKAAACAEITEGWNSMA